jgi:hypothetical protein
MGCYRQLSSSRRGMLCRMNDQERKQWIFDRLKHSLQALSLPAPTQVSLLPEFVVKADELVLDFDHWRVCGVENYRAEMTDAQSDSLAAIDTHIKARQAHLAVWDESALSSHLFWQEIRVLAKQSLDAFGWPLETPPSYAHEYVRGKAR